MDFVRKVKSLKLLVYICIIAEIVKVGFLFYLFAEASETRAAQRAPHASFTFVLDDYHH